MTSLPSYINPELNLDPPSAMDHMESDDDSDDDENRYELWTVRIPVGMKVDELNGVEIDLKALQSGRMELNDGKYVLSQGESNENETFRVLVPDGDDSDSDDSSSSSSNSDSDSSDSEEKKKKKKKSDNKFLLHPSRKGFSRHFNVHQNLLERKTETELAPSKGPDPVGCTLKHSYSHIPQRKGLKRRWMPLGNKQGAISIDPKLITLKPEKVAKIEKEDSDKEEDVSVKQEKTKSPAKKRRRSNSTNSKQEPGAPASAAESPKKKKRSKSKEPKSEKKAKKTKKHKKKVKNEADDAISV